MVPPRRIGNINVLMPMLSHEFAVHPKSTSTRQCLDTLYTIFEDGSRVVTVHKLECQVNEFGFSSLRNENWFRAKDVQSGQRYAIRVGE